MRTQQMIKNWERDQARIVLILEQLNEAQAKGLKGAAHAHLQEYLKLFKSHVSWRKSVTKRIGKKAQRFNKIEPMLLSKSAVFDMVREHESAIENLWREVDGFHKA